MLASSLLSVQHTAITLLQNMRTVQQPNMRNSAAHRPAHPLHCRQQHQLSYAAEGQAKSAQGLSLGCEPCRHMQQEQPILLPAMHKAGAWPSNVQDYIHIKCSHMQSNALVIALKKPADIVTATAQICHTGGQSKTTTA
jgi:hypothetical protein